MTNAPDQITVLMATLNGASFLSEQLESLSAQTLLPTGLIVSDDGSHDETPQILSDFAKRAPFAVQHICGPGKGLAQNIFSLLQAAPRGPVAFADQDDVWLPDKLARAVGYLQSVGTVPTLYAAGRIFTDAQLRPQRRSPRLRRPPDFANALVQNIAPGNTIVLNGAAADLARLACRDGPMEPAFHDWWLYQLIAGAGGRICYDPAHVILYRGHDRNILGPNSGAVGKARRLAQLLNGTYGRWISDQTGAIAASSDRLTPSARALLNQFAAQAEEWPAALGRLNIYRQSHFETLMLRYACRIRQV